VRCARKSMPSLKPIWLRRFRAAHPRAADPCSTHPTTAQPSRLKRDDQLAGHKTSSFLVDRPIIQVSRVLFWQAAKNFQKNFRRRSTPRFASRAIDAQTSGSLARDRFFALGRTKIPAPFHLRATCLRSRSNLPAQRSMRDRQCARHQRAAGNVARAVQRPSLRRAGSGSARLQVSLSTMPRSFRKYLSRKNL